MTKRITTTLLLLSTATVLMTGCTKKGDPGPAGATGATGATGPAGQTLSGNIAGFVTPVEEFGLASTTKSGFTITLEGITPVRTATTDANGRYEFQNVPTGTYNLLYQKAGFSDYRRYGLAHIGGTQLTNAGSPAVVQASNTRVNFARYAGFTSSGYIFNFGLSNPLATTANSSSLRYVMYFSTQPTVSSATADFSLQGSLPLSTAGNATFSITRSTNLSTYSVPLGTTLYVSVYGAPSVLYSYSDFLTGRTNYMGLNPTPATTFSFVVQ
jgi:hypothetical protein